MNLDGADAAADDDLAVGVDFHAEVDVDAAQLQKAASQRTPGRDIDGTIFRHVRLGRAQPPRRPTLWQECSATSTFNDDALRASLD